MSSKALLIQCSHLLIGDVQLWPSSICKSHNDTQFQLKLYLVAPGYKLLVAEETSAEVQTTNA